VFDLSPEALERLLDLDSLGVRPEILEAAGAILVNSGTHGVERDCSACSSADGRLPSSGVMSAIAQLKAALVSWFISAHRTSARNWEN
jgi:hypothetical protein